MRYTNQTPQVSEKLEWQASRAHLPPPESHTTGPGGKVRQAVYPIVPSGFTAMPIRCVHNNTGSIDATAIVPICWWVPLRGGGTHKESADRGQGKGDGRSVHASEATTGEKETCINKEGPLQRVRRLLRRYPLSTTPSK
jgi:hypothetical protein